MNRKYPLLRARCTQKIYLNILFNVSQGTPINGKIDPTEVVRMSKLFLTMHSLFGCDLAVNAR